MLAIVIPLIIARESMKIGGFRGILVFCGAKNWPGSVEARGALPDLSRATQHSASMTPNDRGSALALQQQV